VVFAGTLVLEATQHIDGSSVDVVGLRLSSVLLERDAETGPVVHYDLPLDVYFASAPDLVAQYAARDRRSDGRRDGCGRAVAQSVEQQVDQATGALGQLRRVGGHADAAHRP
jgi:hypothetical protein